MRRRGRIIDALSPSDPETNAGSRASAVPPSAAGALPGIGNLRRMRVEDARTPKAEIVALPVTATLDEVVAGFRDSGFSRLPVFKGTLDSPLGLIHLKDLALQQAFSDPKPL